MRGWLLNRGKSKHKNPHWGLTAVVCCVYFLQNCKSWMTAAGWPRDYLTSKRRLSIPDCQVVVVEGLMQSRQLCMSLFHKTPLDQNYTHIPSLVTTENRQTIVSYITSLHEPSAPQTMVLHHEETRSIIFITTPRMGSQSIAWVNLAAC